MHDQKMIDPQYDWPVSQLEFSDLACTWSKMIDPLVWETRISPRIWKLRFHMHMVKRWLDPPYDWPGSQLEFETSDLPCTLSKMIDLPPLHHPNLQLFVSTGFHIGHHRGLSHERSMIVTNKINQPKQQKWHTVTHCNGMDTQQDSVGTDTCNLNMLQLEHNNRQKVIMTRWGKISHRPQRLGMMEE